MCINEAIKADNVTISLYFLKSKIWVEIINIIIGKFNYYCY